MTEPLKIGCVGGSIQSAVGYAHFTASSMDGIWQIVAGCFSQRPEINAASASQYNVEPDRTYANLGEMLNAEKGKLDAVVILTPTPNHYADVSACLKAGFAVICEKSLAATSLQARKLIGLRNRYKGFLAVTYNYSGYPMIRELAHIISQGKLGKILHFQAEMPQEGFIRLDASGNKPKPQAWRLSDGNIPTLHLDLAVHLHQLLGVLLNEKPIELISDQNHYGWFNGVVDNASCLCRYSNDIQGQLWFSKSALGHRNGLKVRIYGTKASAEWVQTNPEELYLAHVDGRREIIDRAGSVDVSQEKRYNRFKAGHPAGFLEAFANLYADIAQDLRAHQRGEKPTSLLSAEMAFEGLSMLESMVVSAKTRAWQPVKSLHLFGVEMQEDIGQKPMRTEVKDVQKYARSASTTILI